MRVVGSSVLNNCVLVRWLWRWFFLAGGVVGKGCVAGAGGAFRSFSLALNLFGGTPKRARDQSPGQGLVFESRRLRGDGERKVVWFGFSLLVRSPRDRDGRWGRGPGVSLRSTPG